MVASEFFWILVMAVLWLAVQVFRQGKALSDLRQRLSSIEEGHTTASVGDSPAPEKNLSEQRLSEAETREISGLTPKVWPTSQNPKPAQSKPPFVFNSDNVRAVSDWLKEKWFYAVAALSLVLAGVFLVQYGVENGVLTPFWRVVGALSLGIALVVGGEWVRRRASDEEGHAAALPSTLSGAGVVVMFTAVLAARQMYGLIGVEMAFVGLLTVSVLALVLGWFYGPFLSVVGLLGASIAPFLVGGPSSATNPLYAYFALICLVGLAIDTVRRRAWVSVLAVVFSTVAAWVLFLSGDSNGAFFVGFSLAVSFFATVVPVRSLRPTHSGLSVGGAIKERLRPSEQSSESTDLRVEFPTRLAFGGIAAAFAAVLFLGWDSVAAEESWSAFAATVILFAFIDFGLRKAPALWELSAGAVAVFIALIVFEGFNSGPLMTAFTQAVNRPPETSVPSTVYLIVFIGVLMSLALYFRSQTESRGRLYWALGSALAAPLTVISLEIFWHPLNVLSDVVWAGGALGIGSLMVLFTERTARLDAGNNQRAALFATAALGMISFSLVVMLSSAALTVSLAVMIFLAALIDRKYDMWLLSLFAQLGVLVVGFRYGVDPGFRWLAHASMFEIFLVSPIILVLLAGTWFVLGPRDRRGAIVVVESSFWSLLAVFLSAVFLRLIELSSAQEELGISLVAVIMWLSMANQLYRAKEGQKLVRIVRYCLASVFGLVGTVLLAIELIVLNPVWGLYSASVQGPVVFNSLVISYGLPALIFAVVAWKMDHLKRRTRRLCGAIATLLAILFAGLEIRHVWRGVDMESYNGVFDGELYSYTIAMLITSAGLLFFAFSKRNKSLRRFAMVGIGLTIAKVFLLDMSGLDGLIRVASFLGLGLSLAGLAWVNGNMSRQWDKAPKSSAETIE